MNRDLRLLLRHLSRHGPWVLPAAGLATAPSILACACPPPQQVMVSYAVVATDGGESLSCEALCEAQNRHDPLDHCAFTDDGQVQCTFLEGTHCAAGRLPRGRTVRRAVGRGDAVAAWLREMGALELAAVPAFHELARDLAHHGAPRALVGRARAAAADEVRHARAMAALLGRRIGHARIEAHAEHRPVPSLEALALHNAVEGCAREALGALEAAHQALHAEDDALRTTMASIAADEARHAVLSLDVDRWAQRQLGEREGARVRAARAAAIEAMARTPCADPATRRLLGLPDAPAREAMIRALAA